MSAKLNNESPTEEVLAEIRACSTDLQAFVANAFDRLNAIGAELFAREISREQAERQADREALQRQIERLAALADQVEAAVAQPK